MEHKLVGDSDIRALSFWLERASETNRFGVEVFRRVSYQNGLLGTYRAPSAIVGETLVACRARASADPGAESGCRLNSTAHHWRRSDWY